MHDMTVDVPPRAHRRLDTFTVCAPGLERTLESELAALGIRSRRRRYGGVTAPMTARQLYAANLHLRTATRVVVRIARFGARSFGDLERSLRAVEWEPWVAPGAAVDPRASSHRSRLWHTGAVAERVLAAVPGRGAANGSDPAQRVMVRVVHDEVTVSIDSSGEPLHQRGWRLATAKAPLRPTLAAAMLISAGWHGQAPLVDPFCGSGTIPVEAALLARNLAPGLGRAFALQRWPAFEPGTWASVIGAARSSARDTAPVPIVARDRDEGAVAATIGNAGRAGVVGDLDVARAPLSELEAPEGGDGTPGWLVTNPPYGRRLRPGGDLRDLYARLGQVVDSRLAGWTVGLLVDDPARAGHSRLDLVPAWRSTNGGIAVQFLVAAPPA